MRSSYRPVTVRPVNNRQPGAKISAPVPSATSATGLAKFTFLDPVDLPLSAESLTHALRNQAETVDSVKSKEPEELPDGAEGTRSLSGMKAAAQLAGYYGQFIAPEEPAPKKTRKGKGETTEAPAPVAPEPSADGAPAIAA